MNLMQWILMLLNPYRLLVVIIFSGRCAYSALFHMTKDKAAKQGVKNCKKIK